MGTDPVERRVIGNRLAWFRGDMDADFWTRAWLPSLGPGMHLPYIHGFMDEQLRALLDWLPRDGRIVEAGCGFGKYVAPLHSRGYDIQGIDSSRATVEAVARHVPGFPLSVGDVLCLDVPEGHFDAYVSLGVIEHTWEGPEAFLSEAARVTRPGGVAIFSVPWFNPLRQWRARHGAYDGPPPKHPFYQYAFTTEELTGLLAAHGFVPREIRPLGAVKGLRDEVAPLRRLTAHPRLGHRALALLDRVARGPEVTARVGHMVIIAAIRS